MENLAAEVMSQLKYDHIEDYDYILKDDLEVIVENKLKRVQEGGTTLSKQPKGTRVEKVVKSVQGLIDFVPPYLRDSEFETASDLIRNTAVHYLSNRSTNDVHKQTQG